MVVAHADPDERVRGQGLRRLRRAGVEIETGVLAPEAARLNLAFLVSTLEGRPAVTVKWAMSIDGKIATTTGESQWISSPQGRRWALDLREQHDAILVGSGTALADDPSLDRRLGKAGGSIVRVVLDRRLRLPARARMLRIEGPVRVYTESSDARARRALEAAGAVVRRRKRWTPAAVLRDLDGQGVRSLLVEGGGQVLGAFAASGLVDRVEVCCAPRLIGGDRAPGPVGGEGFARLCQALRLERGTARRRGPDIVLSHVVAGRAEELLARIGPA